MQFSKIPKRAGIVGLVLLLGAGIFFYYLAYLRVEPDQLIPEVMQKALQASSYRYRITADYNMSGRKQPWIDVTGEKAAHDVHFTGKILGTPVEIYQTGTRSYTLDPVSNKWVVLEGTDLAQQELYMAQINPLSNFRFKSISEPRLLGTEKVGGRKCWVVEFRPRVDNKIMEMYWKNFTYRFWVDKRSHTLYQALATAENKNSPGTFLSLLTEFRDFNKRIDINPPQ